MSGRGAIQAGRLAIRRPIRSGDPEFIDYYENQHSRLAAMKGLSDPEMLEIRKANERRIFASNSNPVVLVEEHDSPMGPEGVDADGDDRFRLDRTLG